MTSQRSQINIPKAKYVGKRYLSSLSQSPLTLACQRLNLKVLKENRQSVTTICILLKQFGLGIQTDFNYRAVSHILSAPLTYRHQFFQPPKEHPTATKRRVRTGSKRCKDGGACWGFCAWPLKTVMGSQMENMGKHYHDYVAMVHGPFKPPRCIYVSTTQQDISCTLQFGLSFSYEESVTLKTSTRTRAELGNLFLSFAKHVIFVNSSNHWAPVEPQQLIRQYYYYKQWQYVLLVNASMTL